MQPTTDPRWAPDTYNPVERLFLPLIKDERDMIFIRQAARVTAIVLPLAGLMFLLPPWAVAVCALPYLGFVFLSFGGRYGLMLHATGHRPLFRREYRFLNNYIPWVLGPFLGHTPTSFAAHHMMMHHVENNMSEDGSSTLPYRRDHFPHFLHYWFRFFVFGHMHLIQYLVTHGRSKVAARFVFGEVCWFLGAGLALAINPAAAFVVIIMPMLMMRWLMMAGNWAQHSFVDLDNADSGWGNSNCLTNAKYNHKCYNDGYHIIHHLKPALHWSEMAQYYDDNIEEFRRNDALVFSGIADNQAVWFLLMTHNYDKLADHMVELVPRTKEEKIAYLKARVQRQRGEIPSLFFAPEPELELAAK